MTVQASPPPGISTLKLGDGAVVPRINLQSFGGQGAGGDFFEAVNGPSNFGNMLVTLGNMTTGAGNAFVGVDEDDDNVIFADVNIDGTPITSVILGATEVDAGASNFIEVTIDTAGVYKPINLTGFSYSAIDLHKFALTDVANGVLTYTGISPFTFTATLFVHFERVINANVEFDFALFKNGVIVSTTVTSLFVNTADPVTIASGTLVVELVNNDIIEIRVTNVTNNNNISINKVRLVSNRA